jgi:hypothetical protein
VLRRLVPVSVDRGLPRRGGSQGLRLLLLVTGRRPSAVPVRRVPSPRCPAVR